MEEVLTQLLDLPPYRVVGVEMHSDRLILDMEPTHEGAICPRCGRACPSLHENHVRMVRDLPLSGKACFLRFVRRRVWCEQCGRPFSEKVDFVDEYRDYTRRYQAWIFQLKNQEDLTDRQPSKEELQESLGTLRRTFEETVHALASAIEMRDVYTAGHQRRVAQLACAMAEAMGLSEEQVHDLGLAATIHDIGKIHVPAEILSKPSGLTEPEFAIIRDHPQRGYALLKGIDLLSPIAETVYQHHERMDGSGYPQGLSGEAILLEARILSVADVVEAMSSHRPYRPAFGIDKALEEISRHRGVRYDSQVVDACLKVFIEKGMELGPEVTYPSPLTDVDVRQLLGV